MVESNKIKVLVVDDSRVFREILAQAITIDDSIEVIATAEDPFDARDKILKYNPDVMVCDLHMPKMNGVEFIKRLLPQYSIPVIVISSVSDMVFDAMNHGAVDFLLKPKVESAKDVERFFYEITYKIKIAAKAKVNTSKNHSYMIQSSDYKYQEDKIIVIGASTGGTDALYRILSKLPDSMPGIVVVQHIPPVFSDMFAKRLDNQTCLSVKEVKESDYVRKGEAFIAPGDHHIRIKKIGRQYKVECIAGDKVNGHCPSVDVLFQSAAKEAGKDAIGIILTGMGSDGAKGLLEMKNNGAITIGQNEKSCVVYGMPKTAYNLGAVDYQASLDEIPVLLHKLLRKI